MSERKFKYIFVAGAPGSKWSSVARSIWYSPDVDRTDNKNEYNEGNVRHQGAYWGPGMEYGDKFSAMYLQSKEELEAEFDRPFSGTGIRIIKCHNFSVQLNFIRENWPECPIIMCYRSDDACLGWWVKAGGFDITYPNYSHYKSFKLMGVNIANQNSGILSFTAYKHHYYVHSSENLCKLLGIEYSGIQQDYSKDDIDVYLNWS
jgi:hypothetical protein